MPARERGDRRLGVERVRAAVDEQADALVGDLVAPVGDALFPAEPGARLLAPGLVAAGDRDEPRLERRRRAAGCAPSAREWASPMKAYPSMATPMTRARQRPDAASLRRVTVSSVTAASRIAPVTMYFVAAL